MQKTMERLSTLNTFQYHGITQWYMIFRREVNGAFHWQYEWLDVDCEPHASGWFNKIEHVLKGLVQTEQEYFKKIHSCYPNAVTLYSGSPGQQEKEMKGEPTKIPNDSCRN